MVTGPLPGPQPTGGAMWLVDGQNLLHRYFHAVPAAYNAEGVEVHAVRGLASLVARIRAHFAPAGIAVIFDAGHSGRADLLPGYKAGRPDPAPALIAQIAMAREYLPRYGASTIAAPGYEADDVIATLTFQSRAAGHRVYLVTGDKDMHALICDEQPAVAVYHRQTGKAAQGWRTYGAADVRDRFGVGPERLLDLLALTGDSADKIPGVDTIGPKTAAGLIGTYGSLEGLLGLISTVKRPALRERLRAGVESIRLARRLLEPVPVPADALEVRHARIQAPPRPPPRPGPPPGP
jgi:DNA polymerase-1